MNLSTLVMERRIRTSYSDEKVKALVSIWHMYSRINRTPKSSDQVIAAFRHFFQMNPDSSVFRNETGIIISA